MASGGVVAETDPESPVFEEEGRGDGADLKESKKSRKFKPFEAVRKLFKGGKKRTKSKELDNQISVVSVKAKSTTALARAGGHDDDDDSDGGFKSHQSSKLQGGKRSISEDSVFTPGDRGTTDLAALKTVTVSEEHLPKDAFRSELFSKLKKRHSQYSDEDDGLPQSPVPPVTTADIIMGGSLKPHPAKSSSRESEKSLISVDSSDNEADDFVLSRWSSPGKPRSRSSDQSPPPEKGITMDFEAVKSTQALSNEAAKHKRSVKPIRKPQRQSRKRRDNNAPLTLPGILESPTKIQTEDNSKTDSNADSVLTVTSKTGSNNKPSVSMSTVKPTVTASKPDIVAKDTIVKETVAKAAEMPPKPSVEAAKPSGSKVEVKKDVKVEVKKDVPQTSTKPANVPVSLKEEPTLEKSSELSQAMDKMKRRSIKDPVELPSTKSEPSEIKKVSEQKTEVVSSLVKTDSLSKTKPNVPKPVEVKSSKPEETKPVLKKVEDPKPKPEEPKTSIVEKPVDSKPSIIKQHSDDSNKSDTSDAATPKQEVKKDVGFRVSPGNQAKEDYKLKRQSRSKTLPEQPQLPEDFTAKVQRTRSQRNESSPIASEASVQKTASATTPTKMDPRRFTVHETASSEPSWMAAIKKKKAEAENKTQDVKKDLMTTSAKEIVVKETEKPADKMSKSFTATSTSSSLFDSKPEPKKEVLTFNVKRNTSVKASTPQESKTESAPKTFGSVKSPTKSVNIVSSTSASKPSATSAATTSTAKSTATTSTATSTATSTTTSTATSKSFSSTSSSMSKSSTTTSSKPESIKSFGSSFKDKPKDSDKVSPTEEAKKFFTRGQSVKATPTSESTSSPARTASVKAPSGVKPTVGKGSVQSKDSSVEKTQKDPSVPAWRSGVKSVNIEIIEKEPKQEVTLRKASVKKPTPTPAPDPDPCRDSSANRSSKVLDMVKNFQKLQVS